MKNMIVLLEGFTLLREDVPIFEPLFLEVKTGQTVSILGRNGAGKTTLLNSLAGRQRQGIKHSGRCVMFSSTEMLSTTDRAHAGVMLIRQTPTCYRSLHALDQVLLAAMDSYALMASISTIFRRRNHENIRQIASDALYEMGLAEQALTPVAQLSLGQRRALALASVRVRLKVGRLRLLLLDEPASGLDVRRRQSLSDLLDDAASYGCAVIVAEHVGNGQVPLGNTVITLNPYMGNNL
jgi:ABC-type branched-subunit amino acid transport system ATPase component